ncbi:MAG: sigma-70 family RNA polymerase sigma factor [Chitinophagaceae bacterium]
MNHTNENELILQLQQDDVNAFDVLYETYHNSLYSNIYKFTRQAETAQDILQEVFICLWEKRLTLHPHQPIAGWLFVVSYNKSVTYLKKMLRESLQTRNAVTAQKAPENDLLQREDQLNLLEEAIEKLSPQKRKVFELCKIQGKTYEETARELGISKHTVKEYLSGAVSYIKLYVQQHPGHQSVFINSTILLFLCTEV